MYYVVYLSILYICARARARARTHTHTHMDIDMDINMDMNVVLDIDIDVLCGVSLLGVTSLDASKFFTR